MPLLPSLILGLARRPLALTETSAANAILGREVPPADKALALLAAKSLAKRSRLATHQRQQSPEGVPQQEVAPHLTASIRDYLNATAVLCGKPDARLLANQQLILPGSLLNDYLEARFRTPPIPASAYVVLGPRGAWLAARHPRFARRFGYLAQDTFPKPAKQRLGFAAHYLGTLRHSPTNLTAQIRLRAVFGGLKLSPEDFGLLSRAHEQHLLLRTLPAARLLRLVEGRPQLAAHERHWLAEVLQDEAAFAKTEAARRLLSDWQGDLTAANSWQTLAQAVLITKDEAHAYKLLQLSLKPNNLLLTRSPLAISLAQLLPAGSYAHFIDEAVEAYTDGWRDPQFLALVAANPGTFSPALSKRLALEALYHFGPAAESLAARFVHKLHPDAADAVLEATQGELSDDLAAGIVGSLTAMRRLSA